MSEAKSIYKRFRKILCLSFFCIGFCAVSYIALIVIDVEFGLGIFTYDEDP